MKKITKIDLFNLQDNPIIIYDFINKNQEEIINYVVGNLNIEYSCDSYDDVTKNELEQLVKLIDLTSLESSDTEKKIYNLVSRATKPSDRFDLPEVAAICIYGDLVKFAKKRLDEIDNKNIKIASVSTAFPSGRASINVKLLDTNEALKAGADEIDMVIDRGALIDKDYLKVFSEIIEIKKLCKNKTLKVIIESGELISNEKIIIASFIAMLGGADFIKTSTGKISIGATQDSVRLILESIKYFYILTGKKIGIKPSGGIKNYKDGISYLRMVKAILGDEWINPDLFRIGASSMIDDIERKYNEVKK